MTRFPWVWNFEAIPGSNVLEYPHLWKPSYLVIKMRYVRLEGWGRLIFVARKFPAPAQEDAEDCPTEAGLQLGSSNRSTSWAGHFDSWRICHAIFAAKVVDASRRVMAIAQLDCPGCLDRPLCWGLTWMRVKMKRREKRWGIGIGRGAVAAHFLCDYVVCDYVTMYGSWNGGIHQYWNFCWGNDDQQHSTTIIYIIWYYMNLQSSRV